MGFSLGHTGHEQAIVELFSSSFTDSEGADEGKLIGELAGDLMADTPRGDLYVFSHYEGQTLVGCIMFTRLTYAQDSRTVFLLAPVAVRTAWQNKGIGQKLLTRGLDELRQAGVDIAITYGDPNYYSKVGFAQITEEFAQAPARLTQPHGWQAQSLAGTDMQPLVGPSHSVEAFNKPELW